MEPIEAKIETLKSLKEWSTWLVAIDVGALALIGSFPEWENPVAITWIVVAAWSLLASLVTASFLVGAVPVFIQRVGIPGIQDTWSVKSQGIENIYDFRQLGIRLQWIAAAQHGAFLVAAACATIALTFEVRPPQEQNDAKPSAKQDAGNESQQAQPASKP